MRFFSFCSVIFVFGAVAHTACGWSNNEHTIDFKRSPKFILFPRVGRTGLRTWRIERIDNLDKISGLQKRREGEDSKNGLWFGPRLGRFVDNKNAPVEIPWPYILDDESLQKLQKHQDTIEEHQQQQDPESKEVITNISDNGNLENENGIKENSIQYYERNV